MLSNDRRGTNSFRAPELLEFKYDEFGRVQPGVASVKTDIWAIGCILFALCCRGKRSAFRSDDHTLFYMQGIKGHEIPQLSKAENENLQWSISGNQDYPLWQQFNSVIRTRLAKVPAERPSATDLISWLTGIGDEMGSAIMLAFQCKWYSWELLDWRDGVESIGQAEKVIAQARMQAISQLMKEVGHDCEQDVG